MNYFRRSTTRRRTLARRRRSPRVSGRFSWVYYLCFDSNFLHFTADEDLERGSRPRRVAEGSSSRNRNFEAAEGAIFHIMFLIFELQASLSTKLATANATISRSSTRLGIRERELKKEHEKMFVTHQLRHEAEQAALRQELQIARQTIAERDAQLVALTVAQRPDLPEQVDPEDVTVCYLFYRFYRTFIFRSK